jgi:hypothetical protein
MHNDTASSKVTIHPTTFQEGAERELKYRSILSLTSGLVRVGAITHSPDALPPDINGAPLVEGWVGPRVGLEG